MMDHLFLTEPLTMHFYFARKLNYEIVLLHVVDPKLLQSDSILKYINKKTELENSRTEVLDYLKTGIKSMLKENIERARRTGVNVRLRLGFGSVSEGIVDVAAEEKVDFIVMGTKGLSTEVRKSKIKTFGSVARQVLELANCPVMTIR